MPAPTPSPKTIRFGPFLANLRAGELHKNGSKLKLQEQPFKTLAILLERAARL
jgi:DNA-binding winged helix-turn-helix (wHTH) protein